MEDHLMTYFMAEKQEALLFMVLGAAALIVSFYLFKAESAYKGMIYPFIIIAAIQLVVGSTVYFRTDGQVAELTTLLKDDPEKYKVEESQRMERVIKSFRVYKGTEIILLAIGIALTIAFREYNLWYSLGIGLIIESSLMLVLDLFAEKRAHEYIQFVVGS
jgi:hypothetical protein